MMVASAVSDCTGGRSFHRKNEWEYCVREAELIVQPQSQELKSAQILDLCSPKRKPKSNENSHQQ
jgi:hypothetical protein